MATGPGPIMVEASKTRRRLRELCFDLGKKIASGDVPEGVDADDAYLSDCLDRFNIWAGSLGVFQKGEASLDSRLSSHVLVKEVIRLLRQLDQFTSDLRSIVDGDRQQATWSKESLQRYAAEFSDSDSLVGDENESIPTPSETASDGFDSPTTESKDLQLSINESITSLLRLSIQVHKSSARSKFAKSSLHQNYAIGPDISHVQDFFPHAATNTALVERLGKANAQRRQWLWYRRRHREKLSVDLSALGEERLPLASVAEDGDDAPTAVSPVDGGPSKYLPSLTGTKATTFQSRATPTALSRSVITDSVFGRSSRAADDEARLMAPWPPHDLVLSQPYFCRYCCKVVEISGKNAWQKHVHADLSSYSCTFERCGELFFESKHKWWAHENEFHRRWWSCEMCRSQHADLAALTDHLLSAHPAQVPPHQAEGLAQRFGRPLAYMDAADCPLCDYPNVLRRRGHTEEEIRRIPNRKFGRHLGRHLEQLALFVLPHDDLMDDEEGLSDAGKDDSGSDSSDADTRLSLSGPDLVNTLSEVAARHSRAPDVFAEPPDLAMRWQPPQDFTPPSDDFEAEDAELLPSRQEPLYGGDLHTAGWVRGSGDCKEGFCARCPVSHWVTIPDGSYRFHLTYFHGVPESGIPLPRPSSLRPVAGKSGMWEGYCDACDGWRILKKTGRGWSWYRHWLNDHADIIKDRTERTKSSANTGTSGAVRTVQDADPIGKTLPDTSELPTDDELAKRLRLSKLARNDEAELMEQLRSQSTGARSAVEVRNAVNATDETRRTLLMVSASNGMSRAVDLLLDIGADPDAVDADGWTALDFAADAGYFTVVQQLVDGGADTSGSSVLKKILSDEREHAGENTKVAAAVGHASTSSSSSSSGINTATLAPLGRAAFAGDLDAVRSLLGGEDTAAPSQCDVEDGAEVGHSPFLLASLGDHFPVMDLLLSRGANINTTSRHGWTPLMAAAKRAAEPCVAFLLARGADANHQSPDRWTALAEAVRQRATRVAALLLAAGADPEVHAQADWTPLMHAAYRGDLETTRLLLAAGASFDGVSAHDETVMLLAAASGSPVVVRHLLRAGCAPEPIWARAKASPAAAVATGARTEGAERDQPPSPSDAAESRPPLEAAAAPAATTGSQQRIERAHEVGWTPLMVACQVGSLDIVTLLLDAGANPEPRSPMLKTALEIARENGRAEIVEYLERPRGEYIESADSRVPC